MSIDWEKFLLSTLAGYLIMSFLEPVGWASKDKKSNNNLPNIRVISDKSPSLRTQILNRNKPTNIRGGESPWTDLTHELATEVSLDEIRGR